MWTRSLKYHRLHPEYIHQRIERLQSSYNLRILLLLCDVVRTSCFLHAQYLIIDLAPADRARRPYSGIDQGPSNPSFNETYPDCKLDLSNQQYYDHGCLDVRAPITMYTTESHASQQAGRSRVLSFDIQTIRTQAPGSNKGKSRQRLPFHVPGGTHKHQ